MHTPRLRVDEAGQGIDIGRFELGQLAVFDDEVDDRVGAAQLFEYRGLGGVAPAGFAGGR